LRSLGRVITLDHRGLGGSDGLGWADGVRDDAAGLKTEDCTPDGCGRDICALIAQLGLTRGVVLIGNSMAAASVVWAAAEAASGVIEGVVLLAPFAWDHPLSAGMRLLLWAALRRWAGGARTWGSYYRSLYTITPSPVADLDSYTSSLQEHLAQPGRIDVVRQQVFASKAACAARIPDFLARSIPFSVVYGRRDPDFPDMDAEVAELRARFSVPAGGAAASGSGSGGMVAHGPREVAVLPEVGHYPHVEAPAAVAEVIQRLVGGAAAAAAAAAGM